MKKKQDTLHKLALNRKEKEYEREEEQSSLSDIRSQKGEVSTQEKKGVDTSWITLEKNKNAEKKLVTTENKNGFTAKTQVTKQNPEQTDLFDQVRYRMTLSDKDKKEYDKQMDFSNRLKEVGEAYESPYLRSAEGGELGDKLDLKYDNDDWNNLTKAEKEHYLRLAKIDYGDTDDITEDEWNQYNMIRYGSTDAEDSHKNFLGISGRGFTNEDQDERMISYASGIYGGVGGYDKDREQSLMWYSLPENVRRELTDGKTSEQTNRYLRDNFSNDAVTMFRKMGEKVRDAEELQALRESEEELLGSNKLYATVLAPLQQAGADIISGVSAPRTYLNAIKEGNSGYGVVNPYDSYMQKVAGAGQYIGQSIQSTLEERGDALGWLASKSYGVNMSAAESAMRMSLARGVAGAITSAMPMASYDKVAAMTMNAMMGSSVINQELTNMINQGVPVEQAAQTALMRGFFECLFETVSLEKIGAFSQTPVLKTATAKEFAKNLAKAGFTEGMEEVSTDLANDLYDVLMNYDYSDFENFAEDFLERNPGATAEQIRSEYIINKMGQYAGSFFGGAVSGLALGAVSGGLAYNNVNNWANQGVSVNDADYARMASVVESVARQDGGVAETLKQMDEEGVDDVIRRGYFKTVVDSIEKNYSQAIDKATDVKQLDNVMENLNRQTNSVISQDIINKYNAKLVEFGKEGQVDYDAFIQNRDANANTTFSDLAFGNGESAIARNIRQDTDTVAEGFNAVNEGSILSKESLKQAAEAQARLEENKERVSTIVRNYAALGKDLDSPEVRKYANLIGIENSAKAFSEGKLASEETIKTSKVGSIASMTQEEINSEFGENAAHIVDYGDVVRGKQNYQLAYNIGKALTNMGINVRLYASDRNSKIANGFYKNGAIYLDINAGVSGVHAAIGETFSHELTHWIRANNETGYQSLLTFVKNELGDEFDKQVEKELAKLKNKDNNVAEEVVANACAKMLQNSETFKKYAIADMTGAQRILAKLREFVNGLKKAFKGSLYTQASALINDVEGLQKEWEKALQEAIGEQTALEGGIDVETFEDSAVRDAIRDVLDEKQQERVSKMLQEKLGVDKKTADDYVENEQSIASLIFDNLGFLDYKPDDRYEAIKKNSDYPQGTVDMTNLCRKRAIFTQIFDNLQKHFPDRLFNAMDIAEIRQVLKDYGYEVACALCFVEDRRQRVGEIAENFIERLKLAKGGDLTVVNSSGETKILTMTKDLAKQEVAQRAGFKYKDVIRVTDKYIPTQYDLVTYEGFKNLSEKHPQVAAAFIRANNYLGMSSARLVEGRAEYKRQILSYTPAQVKRINNKGGLRIFSFSDFEAVHLLDICQVITDAAAVGLKIQAYTKVPEFAKLVANTGIKLNRSLIPFGIKGYEVLPDGTKKLKYDTKEGINIDHPDFFDSSDNPNIGNILVGINDEHIRLAMLDDFVDYIIPFHSNQGKNVLAVKGISAWTNYKEYQRERYIDGRKGAKDVNIYTQVIDKYNPTNKVEFVNAFLKECKAQGKIPRFDQFLNKVNGEYVYTPGYEKLLLDFKLFDKRGNILPQTNVNPNIDMTVAKRILNDEVKGAAKREQVSGKIINELENKYEKRYASREKITMGMSDEERETILRDSVMEVRDYSGEADKEIAIRKEDLEKHKIGLIKDVLWKAAKAFGLNEVPAYNSQYDLSIEVNRGTFSESVEQGIRDPEQIIKLMPMLRESINNAVGLQVSKNRYYSDTNTAEYLDMLGGYFDRGLFIPVRFGIKIQKNHHNALHVVIDAEGIKKDKVIEKARRDNARIPDSLLSNVSVAKILENVNSKIILRYIPDGMLSEEKKVAKSEALANTQRRTDRKNNKDYSDFIIRKNYRAARSMLKNAAPDYGFFVDGKDAYHTKDASILRPIKDIAEGKAMVGVPFTDIFKLTPEEQARVDRANNEDARNSMRLAEESLDNANDAEKEMLSGNDIRYSQRVTDQDTLDFLNNQEYITTYRSFQLINGGLYSPMNQGREGYRTELDVWEQSTEITDFDEAVRNKVLIPQKNGGYKYNLKSGNNTTSGKNRTTAAAYNPYLHSSNSVLNDQFAAAYDRPNLVVVECRVPKSEASRPYKAKNATDPVGWKEWKSGKASTELAKNGGEARGVFLSRWMKAERILPYSEVAQMYKDALEGTDITIAWNVVPPGLRHELEKIGVPIDYSYKNGNVTFENMFPDEAYKAGGTRFSSRDGAAVFTEERVDRLLRQYGSKSTPKYAQAYAAYISPEDFLMLTTNDLSAIERESRELNEQELRDNTQEIFLKIEERDGKMVVYGHEGRHRMVALHNQGVKEVAISVIDLATKYTKEITDSMTLSHQIFNEQNEDDFDADVEQKAEITDLIPISYENEDILKRRFTGEHQVMYASRDSGKSMAELDEEYENAYNDYDDDRMQEIVDTAAEKAGYKYKAFHHTESSFTVFDLSKARRSMDIHGFFFSADPEAEREYGSKRYDVYLKMNNPYIVDSKESAGKIPFDMSKEDAGVTAREWLIENGYDSVIRKADYYGAEADEYVVLDSNQIKSADAMTFDDDDNLIMPSERFNDYENDIRFSPRDIANSESEMLVNALKNDSALASDTTSRYSLEQYANEYNNLRAMEQESFRLAKKLKKASPSQRDVLTKKILRLDRQILKATEKLTEMRTRRVLTDVLVSEWEKRLADVEWTNELTFQKTKKALEDRYGRAITGLKMKSKEQKQEIRDRYEINKRKKNIEKKTKEIMNRILHPTEKKHIPSILINPIVEMLDSIDNWTPAENRRVTKKSESMRERFINFREAVNRYQKEIDEGAELTEYMFDPEFLETVDELCESVKGIDNVNDMSVSDIVKLDQTLTELNHLIARGNKMITASHYATINDAVGETYNELSKREDVRKAKGNLYQRLNAGMSDSYAFGQYGGAGAANIIDMLSKAFEKKILQVRQGKEFAENLLKGKDTKSWSKDKIAFRTEGGQTIELTVAQMMELYLLNNREQARGHIYGGGINIEDKKGKFRKAVKVTEEDVNNIIRYLQNVPEAIEVADALQNFGATTVTGWGNEASNLLYGISKFTDPNYWQIRSDSASLKDNANSEAQANASMFKLQNLGRTKAVKKNANNAIYIGDVFDTYAKTIDEMSSYGSILPATTDAMRWYNSSVAVDEDTRIRVKALLQNKLGTDMARVFTDTIRALNGGILGTDSLESLVKVMTGRAKAAAVAGNLRVVLQQPTAYTRAFSVIPAKYLLRALTMKPASAEAQEKSPIAWHKAQGFYSNGLAPSLRKLIVGDQTVGESITEKALWLAGKADDITWGALWNASKLMVNDTTNLQKGSDEYWKKVNEVFSDIINKTQVVDTPLTKSTWMRGNGVGIYFTAFMAEPTKTYSMVSTAIDRVLQHPHSAEAKKALAIAGFTFGLNAIVNAFAQAIADAARDDDKEKDYFEKFREQWQEDVVDNLNPLTYVPVVKDAWSAINGYSSSRLDLQAIQNSVYAMNELKKIASGKSTKTLFGQVEQVSKAVSSWTGIPVSNVMRTMNSFGNLMGIDAFRRKKYTNTELARNIALSVDAGNAEDVEKYTKELSDNLARSNSSRSVDDYVSDYLADHSEKIDEWAERYYDDPTTLNDAIADMSEWYSPDVVVSAIKKSINHDAGDDKSQKVSTSTAAGTIYNGGDINRMLKKGDIATAQEIIDTMQDGYAEMGSSASPKTQITSYWKPIYQSASLQEKEDIRKMLYKLNYKGKQMYSAKDFDKWK